MSENYHLKYATKAERLKRIEEIRSEILSSREALEILGFSRMRLSQISRDGRITPIRDGIYLKDDIIAFKLNRNKKLSRN